MLLSFLEQFSGVVLVVVVIALALGIAIGLLEAFASTANLIIAYKRRKLKKANIANGQTASQAARVYLDSNGMSDVKVEQAGFWRGFFYGNHYSFKKNTFYIRKRQMQTTSLGQVTDTVQRVAKAICYKEGDKKKKKLIKFQNYIPLLPYVVIPIILVGLFVDAIFFHFQNNALVTLISLIISLLYFIFTAILMFMTIKVEKEANEKALDLMARSNFLTQEETEKVTSLFKWRIIAYVADFIIALIRIIQIILKILATILKGVAKGK